jgi:cytochrome c oxidase subunit 3
MKTVAEVTPDRHHEADDAHIQHHFETAGQQFSASKLGMWLFLATELLMFGGLFCAYAIYRGNHPEMFAWGSKLMNVGLGGVNTLVLITSSLTMAAAVRCAQLGQRKRLTLLLSLTFLGGCGFLGIKYLEYRPKFEHGLLWGSLYRPDPAYVLAHFGDGHHEGEDAHAEAEEEAVVAYEVDLERGKGILLQTCASCHGADLRGMPNNGVNLLTSKFVGEKTDEELLAFVKVGRQPFDPASTTGVAMPPRGGNPTLDDDELRDTIAMLRVVREQTAVVEAAGPAAEGDEVAGSETAAAALGLPAGGELLPRSVLPPAPQGPPGLALAEEVSFRVPEEPENMHHFFGIYFMMTGLHGIHVLAGMILIGWLIVGAAMGRFHAGYFTPVDLIGLFWHLVDLIWIFLFPLFYLI